MVVQLSNVATTWGATVAGKEATPDVVGRLIIKGDLKFLQKIGLSLVDVEGTADVTTVQKYLSLGAGIHATNSKNSETVLIYELNNEEVIAIDSRGNKITIPLNQLVDLMVFERLTSV